jgi:hypothetical protein
LESTGFAREYKWTNGKNVTFNGGWCEGEPAGTLKEVYLQATTYYMGGDAHLRLEAVLRKLLVRGPRYNADRKCQTIERRKKKRKI